jgi:hypothetical protein
MIPQRWPVPVLLALALLARRAAADEARLDARTLWDKAVTSNVRLSADGSALELDRGELFEDDGAAAGYSYKPNEEKLSAGTWVKKEFVITDPRATKATLLVGPGGALKALINGKPQQLRAAGKAGQYWQAYELPPESLQAGKNDIILHGSGKVWIARDDEFALGSHAHKTHPNRSAKSTDAGKTWSYERLGAGGDVDGEYYVRLFLDRRRPRGLLTLPVLDLGNLAEQPVAAPVSVVGPVRIAVEAENEAETRISVRVRSGTTYVPDEKHWSPWRQLGEAEILEEPVGRYLQAAVQLATADPFKTPRLQRVLIDARPTRPADWTKDLRVLDCLNPEIVRTSIPFAYEPFDHPRLKDLRRNHRLDDVVKGAKGEFELILRLAAWSSKQWVRGHLREAYPPWDALEILKPHADGTPVGGFCQQYNVVFLQACESFGLVGRAVSLGPGDHGARIRSGHEVVEIWSNEHGKWVYVDGQMAWCLVDQESGTPLSLLELRERQLASLRGKPAAAVKLVMAADTGRRWQGLDSFPPFVELRLIPRSNFLQEQAPLPLNQGMRGWFWTGHYVWTDGQAPASLLYGNRVVSRRNWEWTLNQTRFALEATAIPGELRVHLDTETPGFGTFLADVDRKGKQPIASGFLWKLREGKNRLDVGTRNSAGGERMASRIILAYSPGSPPE